MITTGDRVRIEKGCKTRDIAKGTTAQVTVTPLGAEYSHQVRVSMKFLNGFKAGQTISFYARSQNRLSDPVVNLNDGNPTHTLQIVKKVA